jgi:AcrR family transcriptional regulator
MREVSKLSGVSHAAPYRHFRDKGELLCAVAIEGFEMVISETRKRFENTPDPLSRFQESGLAYIDFAASCPSHYRVMFSSVDYTSSDELAERSHESFMLLVDSIRICQELELVRNADPFELALASWSLVHGYAMLILDGFIREPSDRLKHTITETLYQGLRHE